jgi:para-nitrobenzyl esterase
MTGRPPEWALAACGLLGGCMTAGPPPPASPSPLAARTVVYVCEGGERLTARFGEGSATIVDAQGRSLTLKQQVSGSGILYEGQGQTLRGKGEEMTWTAAGGEAKACSAGTSPLAGTRWQLTQFRAADGKTSAPAAPDRYVMEFLAGGRLALRLDCNRATGRWEAHASGADVGSISLGAPAMTRALCLGESWDTRIAREIGMAQRYTLAGDRLEVALGENGGVYSWSRLPGP